MSTINWTTVITAATTAGLVTIAVEYAAKPRLEARKDRILETLRNRRELVATALSAALTTEFLLHDLPADADRELRDTFRAERKRHYERVQQQVQTLYDSIGKYGTLYRNPVRDLVIQYIMQMYGVILSRRTQRRKAEIIKGLTAPMIVLLDGPKHKLVARAVALKEIRRLMDEIENDPPSGENGAT
ncbi:hypothetical protein AB0M79_09735 [Polymorphospora sp. NPDC051019]|uniref:hypothetical protein n=1 Tax=Polymorphospora sp. NPDC051019 TaxID=3155725 RepID=UPI00343A9D1D